MPDPVATSFATRRFHIDGAVGLDAGVLSARVGYQPIAQLSLDAHVGTIGIANFYGVGMQYLPLAGAFNVSPSATASYSFMNTPTARPELLQRGALTVGVQWQANCGVRLGAEVGAMMVKSMLAPRPDFYPDLKLSLGFAF